ncbi:Ankyrin repeat domain-containing protein 50 [Hondaea fermentalgiana]|uniref:Ankyrin repeat domain-containing protein 50 n=1 Tax=Hondaea fermentalgiana TaxID=2315210 RepID=A0A2R5G2E4_9STRA|nr:Ankyrin repeat domain-containing protein 50 [Hondaea fermentalgiana]|eukprot:GBG24705.1 Ankyrin repeat domain-containing protein 50 [Hondaea fermentalgiana]
MASSPSPSSTPKRADSCTTISPTPVREEEASAVSSAVNPQGARKPKTRSAKRKLALLEDAVSQIETDRNSDSSAKAFASPCETAISPQAREALFAEFTAGEIIAVRVHSGTENLVRFARVRVMVPAEQSDIPVVWLTKDAVRATDLDFAHGLVLDSANELMTGVCKIHEVICVLTETSPGVESNVEDKVSGIIPASSLGGLSVLLHDDNKTKNFDGDLDRASRELARAARHGDFNPLEQALSQSRQKARKPTDTVASVFRLPMSAEVLLQSLDCAVLFGANAHTIRSLLDCIRREIRSLDDADSGSRDASNDDASNDDASSTSSSSSSPMSLPSLDSEEEDHRRPESIYAARPFRNAQEFIRRYVGTCKVRPQAGFELFGDMKNCSERLHKGVLFEDDGARDIDAAQREAAVELPAGKYQNWRENFKIESFDVVKCLSSLDINNVSPEKTTQGVVRAQCRQLCSTIALSKDFFDVGRLGTLDLFAHFDAIPETSWKALAEANILPNLSLDLDRLIRWGHREASARLMIQGTRQGAAHICKLSLAAAGVAVSVPVSESEPSGPQDEEDALDRNDELVFTASETSDWCFAPRRLQATDSTFKYTILHVASALAEDADGARVLLQGRSAMTKDAFKATVVHYGAANENASVFQVVVDACRRTRDLVSQDDFGITPLMTAAICARAENVRILVNAIQKSKQDLGGELTTTDKKGLTALVHAIYTQRDADRKINTVRSLLELGAKPDHVYGPQKETGLHAAARVGDLGSARLLIEFGAHVDAKTDRGLTPLMIACMNGHEQVAAWLVHRGGADIKALDLALNTPLHYAAAYGWERVVGVLLCLGAPPDPSNEWGRTPVSVALQKRHMLVAKVLVPLKEVDITLHDACQRTLVHRLFREFTATLQKKSKSARANHLESEAEVALPNVEAVQKIQQLPMDQSRGGLSGWPAIMQRAPRLLKCILLHRQDAFDANDACCNGVSILMTVASANVSKEDNDGLMSLAQALLQRGADPNAGTTDGWQAIHLASIALNVPMLELLLNHGAKYKVSHDQRSPRASDFFWHIFLAVMSEACVDRCKMLEILQTFEARCPGTLRAVAKLQLFICDNSSTPSQRIGVTPVGIALVSVKEGASSQHGPHVTDLRKEQEATTEIFKIVFEQCAASFTRPVVTAATHDDNNSDEYFSNIVHVILATSDRELQKSLLMHMSTLLSPPERREITLQRPFDDERRTPLHALIDFALEECNAGEDDDDFASDVCELLRILIQDFGAQMIDVRPGHASRFSRHGSAHWHATQNERAEYLETLKAKVGTQTDDVVSTTDTSTASVPEQCPSTQEEAAMAQAKLKWHTEEEAEWKAWGGFASQWAYFVASASTKKEDEVVAAVLEFMHEKFDLSLLPERPEEETSLLVVAAAKGLPRTCEYLLRGRPVGYRPLRDSDDSDPRQDSTEEVEEEELRSEPLLLYASRKSMFGVVQLLQSFVDPLQAVRAAVQAGELLQAKNLMQILSDDQLRSSDPGSGQTLLHLLASLSKKDFETDDVRLEIARTLLALGVDPNVCASNGRSAVEEAATSGSFELCALILDNKHARFDAVRLLQSLLACPAWVATEGEHGFDLLDRAIAPLERKGREPELFRSLHKQYEIEERTSCGTSGTFAALMASRKSLMEASDPSLPESDPQPSSESKTSVLQTTLLCQAAKSHNLDDLRWNFPTGSRAHDELAILLDSAGINATVVMPKLKKGGMGTLESFRKLVSHPALRAVGSRKRSRVKNDEDKDGADKMKNGRAQCAADSATLRTTMDTFKVKIAGTLCDGGEGVSGIFGSAPCEDSRQASFDICLPASLATRVVLESGLALDTGKTLKKLVKAAQKDDTACSMYWGREFDLVGGCDENLTSLLKTDDLVLVQQATKRKARRLPPWAGGRVVDQLPNGLYVVELAGCSLRAKMVLNPITVGHFDNARLAELLLCKGASISESVRIALGSIHRNTKIGVFMEKYGLGEHLFQPLNTSEDTFDDFLGTESFLRDLHQMVQRQEDRADIANPAHVSTQAEQTSQDSVVLIFVLYFLVTRAETVPVTANKRPKCHPR